MGKLPPPLLDGTIPAFCSTSEGIKLLIPFTMSRAVNLSQIKQFHIKLKTIQSGIQLYAGYVNKSSAQDNIVKAILPSDISLRVGQYYKIQMAYVNLDDTIGYYSTVAIAKYTTAPALSISDLKSDGTLNGHRYTYVGVYDQRNGDKTEKVYSYRFDLYLEDNKSTLIHTSGDLLHDNSEVEDEPGLSYNSYTIPQDLEPGKTHRIKYTITTNNGLVQSTQSYRIIQKKSIKPELNAHLTATANYENGYVDLNLISNNINELSSGFFIIARASEESNYVIWEEIHRFSLVAQIATRHLYRDFTVEQGKKYIYGIQQYNNNNIYSDRIISNPVFVDFEDAFLYDGKQQLKIKYNPKISNFKKDLLETKIDTIGGKHPFIFRNGRVYYSEFPISGLISYQMDEEKLFLSDADYGLTENTISLNGENIAAERIFKMKVLEWLTNGQPKIFRSPTEGNFIVRLMNSSLAPNDTLGRMLHTFSCTAYEIAEFNYETLKNMGFIVIGDQTIVSLHWKTVDLKKMPTGNTNLLHATARTVRFDGMVPGSVIKIWFKDGHTTEVKIGVTGSYHIDTGVEIEKITFSKMLTDFIPSGSMTYSYYYVKEPTFNNISDIEIYEVPLQQFIGEHDILQELLHVYDSTNKIWVKNPKLELIKVHSVGAEKRPLQRINGGKNFNKDKCIDPFLIYEVGTIDEVLGVAPNRPSYNFKLYGYYDSHNDKITTKYEPYLIINGEIVSVNETETVNFINPGDIIELKCGNGSLTNLCYQMGEITYKIENDAKKVYSEGNTNHYLFALGEAINKYDTAVNNLSTTLNDENSALNLSVINKLKNDINTWYNKYILRLVDAQKEEARMRGEIV